MRIRAAVVLLAVVESACIGGGGWFRQYEYEEEMYLELDGSATMYVNSSIPALNQLRGTSFDARPTTRIDRDAIRAYFTTPVTHVTRVTTSRRSGRQFVHVRLDVDDVGRLGSAAPFAWSSYRFGKDGELYRFAQSIGAAARGDSGGLRWNGDEVVAFRVHIPSKVVYHNALADNLKRGNILVWEQPLEARLKGTPLTLDARIQTESILYRTLWLFGATFVAVAFSFGVVVWWILRRGARAQAVAAES